MKRSTLMLASIGLLGLGITAGTSLGQEQSAPAGNATATDTASRSSVEQQQNQVIGHYCLQCHNDSTMRGGLSLESFDVSRAHENASEDDPQARDGDDARVPGPEA